MLHSWAPHGPLHACAPLSAPPPLLAASASRHACPRAPSSVPALLGSCPQLPAAQLCGGVGAVRGHLPPPLPHHQLAQGGGGEPQGRSHRGVAAQGPLSLLLCRRCHRCRGGCCRCWHPPPLHPCYGPHPAPPLTRPPPASPTGRPPTPPSPLCPAGAARPQPAAAPPPPISPLRLVASTHLLPPSNPCAGAARRQPAAAAQRAHDGRCCGAGRLLRLSGGGGAQDAALRLLRRPGAAPRRTGSALDAALRRCPAGLALDSKRGAYGRAARSLAAALPSTRPLLPAPCSAPCSALRVEGTQQ